MQRELELTIFVSGYDCEGVGSTRHGVEKKLILESNFQESNVKVLGLYIFTSQDKSFFGDHNKSVAVRGFKWEKI